MSALLMFVLLAADSTTPAAGSDPEVLCLELGERAPESSAGQPTEAVAIDRLAVLVRTVAIGAAGDPACTSARHSFRGRFVARGPDVYFVLRGPRDAELDRRVPWVDDAPAALTRLSSDGHLGKLAVLVEGLLAEERLGLSAPGAQAAGEPDAIAGEPDDAWRLAAAAPPPSRVDTRPEASSVADWRPGVSGGLLARFRSPGIGGPALALAVSWGPWSAEGTWTFDAGGTVRGRAISAGSAGLSAAWAPTLWSSAWGLALRPRVALVLEHVWVRRADLDEPTQRAYWDLGMGGGGELVYGLTRWLELGGRAEITWYPTAREVEIPAVGGERLNDVGVTGGFFARAVIRAAAW